MTRRLIGFLSAYWVVIVLVFAVAGCNATTPQPPLALVSAANNQDTDSALVALDVNPQALDQLRAQAVGESVAVQLIHPADQAPLVVEVARYALYAPGVQTKVMTPLGPQVLPTPTLRFFRGTVAGDPQSAVALTVGDAYVMGTIRMGNHIYRLGPQTSPFAGNSVPHMAYHLTRKHLQDWSNRPLCALQDGTAPSQPTPLPGMPTPPGSEKPPTGKSGAYLQVELALDGDHELYTKFGSNPDAVFAYYGDIINNVNVIYKRDLGLNLDIASQRVWATTDHPYTASDTEELLDQLQAYFIQNESDLSRDVVHLISGKTIQGGIAYIQGMCDTTYGYSLSQVYGQTDTVTEEGLWDTTVIAHELGHNAGAEHTHDYGLDTCPTDPWGCDPGTIMSYCHLCGGNANILLEFDPYVIERIAEFIDTTTCLDEGYPRITNREAVTDVTVAADEWYYATLEVPAGATHLSVSTAGGTGHADLYVRAGELPNETTFDCRSRRSGTTERCLIASPQGTTYYIAIKATTASNGLTLHASYADAGSVLACQSPEVTRTGVLAAGERDLFPTDGPYLDGKPSFTSPSGASARLAGPTNANFDLYVYEYTPEGWQARSSSTTPGSLESVLAEGSGTYSYEVHATSGAGTYTLCQVIF